MMCTLLWRLATELRLLARELLAGLLATHRLLIGSLSWAVCGYRLDVGLRGTRMRMC
jgi:hypothetical protein